MVGLEREEAPCLTYILHTVVGEKDQVGIVFGEFS